MNTEWSSSQSRQSSSNATQSSEIRSSSLLAMRRYSWGGQNFWRPRPRPRRPRPRRPRGGREGGGGGGGGRARQFSLYGGGGDGGDGGRGGGTSTNSSSLLSAIKLNMSPSPAISLLFTNCDEGAQKFGRDKWGVTTGEGAQKGGNTGNCKFQKPQTIKTKSCSLNVQTRSSDVCVNGSQSALELSGGVARRRLGSHQMQP